MNKGLGRLAAQLQRHALRPSQARQPVDLSPRLPRTFAGVKPVRHKLVAEAAGGPDHLGNRAPEDCHSTMPAGKQSNHSRRALNSRFAKIFVVSVNSRPPHGLQSPVMARP